MYGLNLSNKMIVVWSSFVFDVSIVGCHRERHNGSVPAAVPDKETKSFRHDKRFLGKYSYCGLTPVSGCNYFFELIFFKIRFTSTKFGGLSGLSF